MNEFTIGDQPEPQINMPVSKNEIMLLQIALDTHKLYITESSQLGEMTKKILFEQIELTKKKLASNEESYNSLHGKGANH